MDRGRGGLEFADQFVAFVHVDRALIAKMAFPVLLPPLRIPVLLTALGWFLRRVWRYPITFAAGPPKVDVRSISANGSLRRSILSRAVLGGKQVVLDRAMILHGEQPGRDSE